MKTLKNFFSKHHFFLQSMCCMALAVATFTANSRCAYIFHNPKKPDSLKQLQKY